MKITGVRLIEYRGRMAHPETFWEERLVRPVDLYPEHRDEGRPNLVRRADGTYDMRSIFVRIETDDDGLVGIGGPVADDQVYTIARQLAPLMLGQDPLATERLWDLLYRAQVHGRKGTPMMALSAVDCALWDLRGKWADAPVYRLLGGPTRPSLPAYASALGYSIDPDRAAERARGLVEQGYRAMKWFFRHGPWDGQSGIGKNVALVRKLREAVGPDVDLMLDAWMSWDVPYCVTIAERIAELRPRWLEEPVLPDRVASYAEIRRRLPFPIAGGEHEYNRWGLKSLLDAGACDVLQPDIYWAGGISEMLKIAALASCYDVQLVPHGHSTPATVHFLLSQPANLCPVIEYLIKWNQIHQFFLRDRIEPRNGTIAPNDSPGIGMEIDETRVESAEELRV